MAITQTINLDGIGMDDVAVKAYININTINIQFRKTDVIFHATLNVYANKQARLDGKNVIGIENITGVYNPATADNIHAAVYNLAKTYPQFADAEDA